MKRFLILCAVLALVLLASRAWPAGAEGTVTVEFSGERDEGGGRTSSGHFFDHRFEARGGSESRRWRASVDPGVERVEGGYRFSYRDRDYDAVWLRLERDGFEPLRMSYDPDLEVWTVTVDLAPGRVTYQFRVRRQDGGERDRTDPTNPTRRRDADHGWVSRVEIAEDGGVRLGERRTYRRSRGYDFDFEFDGVGADYQRADGFFARVSPSFASRDPWAPALHTTFGYGFASERGSVRMHFVQPLVAGGRFRAVVSGHDFTDYTDRTGVGDMENSLATLVFREDSRDWFRRKGLSAGLELERVAHLLVRMEFRSDDYESLERQVHAGWGGRARFLPILPVGEGTMRSVLLRTRWGDDLTHLWAEYENGRADRFSSAFDFERIVVQARARVQVGWAQELHLRARWGAELGGELPAQKRFLAGGLGTVRGYRYQSLLEGNPGPGRYGGAELALLNAEYLLGVHDEFSVALFVDSGMAWAEAGNLDLADLESSIGLGLVLSEPGQNALRLDFIQPLESDGSVLVQGRLTRPF